MKTYVTTKNIILGTALVVLVLFSCSKDEESTNECNSSDASVNIDFEKVSEKCSEINLLWDITFGVSVEFEVDVKCQGDCLDRIIIYQIDQYVKRQDSILNSSNGIRSSFYICNKVINPIQTLNTRKDNPGSFTYMVGDTLKWDFLNPRLCLSEEASGCSINNNSKPLDLPEFSFEYVVTQEDFDCE